MALDSLLCAHVPLRTYTPTHISSLTVADLMMRFYILGKIVIVTNVTEETSAAF